jgi:predicted RNA binding protein YcfA (HicA-like mRNA interferase family)
MAVGDTIRLAAGNWLIVTVRDIIKAMELDGWRLEKRTATGHRKFSHPAKPGKVTVSGQLGEDVPTGTLRR